MSKRDLAALKELSLHMQNLLDVMEHFHDGSENTDIIKRSFQKNL